MFKWLTRKDGAKIERAKRRLKSPRGSVFVEFAIVVPLLVMLSSALIEVTGFWDAQVMANHTAWTVGRIAMVRGSDGLAFSSDLDKKSKTGIAGSSMPQALKDALAALDTYIGKANLFNNRGNVATLFLMSTCGIGYFGKTPETAVRDIFKDLCDAGVKALTEGIKGCIEESLGDIKLPSIGGGGNFLEELINKVIKELLEKLLNALLKPLAEALKALLEKAFEFIMAWLKIDDWFSGDDELAYHARQIYGAAQRIVRANETINKEVLTVKDLDADDSPYLFSKSSLRKRLVYPQCVDSDSKSDGYFVKDPSGWPPNNNGLAMVHVEIDWPYESGWLFPVVSGYGSVSAPPVAKGHSMVFPQPNIANDNLYSEGAKAFEPGSYTNAPRPKAFEDLANEMKQYLKGVKFCMQYRICEDKVTVHDGDWSWESWTDWKDSPELMDVFGIKSIPAPGGSEYVKTWEKLTGTSSQRPPMRDIEDHFDPSYYRNVEYFYWEGAWHKRYGGSIVAAKGNSGLSAFYDNRSTEVLCYKDDSVNMFGMSAKNFEKIHERYKKKLKEAIKKGDDSDWVFDKVKGLANRIKVNVSNLVKYQIGHDYSAWKNQDAEIDKSAKVADGMFNEILKLLHKEIAEIDDILNDTAQYSGSPEDPVLDPEDEGVVKDPDAAAAKAREKWRKMKENLKLKLADVDAAAVKLRGEWSSYAAMVDKFKSDRGQCIGEYFAVGCINMFIVTKDPNALDKAGFRFQPDVMPYDIGKGTRQMLKEVTTFATNVVDSYNKEVEYGAALGLESAGEAKREGKSPEEIVDGGGDLPGDKGGSLAPGDDKGDIIDRDRQTYRGGKWEWK